MIAVAPKRVLELLAIIKLKEMVIVVMLLCKHKCAGAAQVLALTMVVADKYAMIIVANGAVALLVQQHVQIVLVLDHVALRKDVVALKMATYVSRFKMIKKETR
jgi:hypothetical protein